MIDVKVLPSSDEALQAAAECVNSFLKQSSQVPVLFLSSGGSALQMVEQLSPELFTSLCTISVLDERYSTDVMVLNFAELTRTSFYNSVHGQVQEIDTRPKEGENGEQLAARVEADIRAWREEHTGGVVLATIGVGVDGHVAGIMPYPEDPEVFTDMFLSDQWVTFYSAAGKNQYPERVTTTCAFLRSQVDHAVVYVCGMDKKNALGRVTAESGSLAETPGRILQEMKDVHIFTDIT